MTHQQPTQTHDDEASSLLTSVTTSPAPSLSLVQGGGMPARKKKNGGVLMRTMIVTTCFLLVTIAVIYGGRGGSSNTAGSGGISAALLLGQNQAASVYDPGHDWCFTDHENPGKLCWYPIHRYPCGNWAILFPPKTGMVQCGEKCTKVYCYRHGRHCDFEPDESQCEGHP